MLNKVIRYFLDNQLIALLLFLVLAGWGVTTAPFDWDLDWWPRDAVPVDAIPDLSDNQQIIFTDWPGNSPQDVEDQITYPLSTELLGVPGVRTVRSNSMFGFSSINVIFEEDVEFYWSRARILEKLSALSSGTLPEGVQPALGPDATALGQIFWYTLEGRDSNGNPAGNWDPQELRSIQDYQVRYALSSVGGVAEVASIGGYVKEYQIDIDPDAMREAGVNVVEIADAIRASNMDAGARTLEMNRVEYVVRGLGYIESLDDIKETVVTSRNEVPIRIKDVARVNMGPAQRRGVLDKAGADAVGGVVVARYGENPLQVINNVKEEIERISVGLPTKTLDDGTVSRVEIVPFYDRSGLIYETLVTLEEALSLQILITIIVVIIMVMHLRSSAVISGLLPLAVLMSFIMMRYIGVDANVVALAGIAISIGTVVDMGIILTENMLRHMDEAHPEENRLEVIYRAVTEVSSAVITALLTTIVSFLPVFMLQAEEGRLFGPLAFTKTFILIAALIIVLTLIPSFAYRLFSRKAGKETTLWFWNGLMAVTGLAIAFTYLAWAGLALLALAVSNMASMRYKKEYKPWSRYVNNGIILLAIGWLLASNWLPLGPENPISLSLVFIALIVGVVFGLFWLFIRYYARILASLLDHRMKFFALLAFILLLGSLSWRGYDTTFRWMADGFNFVGMEIEETSTWSALNNSFPGLGNEFMPTLDEGSFLLMPTAMPHAGSEASIDFMREMDMRIASIPEVDMIVGKAGRVESALDPAPLSMFESVITYKSEYKMNERGRRVRYEVNENGEFVRDEQGKLNPDRRGRYYRQWRSEIQTEDDIWNEIVQASDLPGITSAPQLQPIETRQLMLQTGMRSNMGIRIEGPTLEVIDGFATQLEEQLRQVDGIRAASVFADRVVGKPYLEFDIDREAIGRHGLQIMDVQNVISTAVGGQTLTTTVEGRERYPVRVRYAREYRDNPEAIRRILVPTPAGYQIPLGQLGEIRFEQGPMNIRSENTFLSAYVTFDTEAGYAPVDIVDRANEHLDRQINEGSLMVPAGTSYTFEGEYRQQQRAAERFMIVVPITLIIIFLLMYFQFRSTPVTLIIFSGIILVWAGGFIMLWLYGQDWFFNFSLFGVEMRELLQMGTINLSVAVWVGFLALFGIAVDNGVVLATYLEQLFERDKPDSVTSIRKTAIKASFRRVRPCLMTTGTTLLALLPILTSSGKGSEIMVPMAIPIFGGMFVQLLTLLLIPMLYVIWKEYSLKHQQHIKKA
ncbi:MAG: efflux RND transporter permease subunit [Balneolales bacterium]